MIHVYPVDGFSSRVSLSESPLLQANSSIWPGLRSFLGVKDMSVSLQNATDKRRRDTNNRICHYSSWYSPSWGVICEAFWVFGIYQLLIFIAILCW
jgi:hypothetical protein